MSTEKLYNLNAIYQAVGENKESTKEMIRIFLDTLPKALKNLHIEVESENWETVQKIAHSTKSNIDMLEIKSSFYKIKEIERLAKERTETEKIPVLLNEIKKEMTLVFEDLQAEIN